MPTRLEDAVAAMRVGIASRKAEAFALPDSRFHMRRREAAKRATACSSRKFVKPHNATGLVAHLPGPGEILHAILRGDFVVGDALPLLITAAGPCPHLRISTLGLSVKNAKTLRELILAGSVEKLTLICSHYFRAVDKLGDFLSITALLQDLAEIKVARCHAKIILLPTATHSLVFETSGNLRSSDCLEQMTVFNDPELHTFHASWMDELKTLPMHAPKKNSA